MAGVPISIFVEEFVHGGEEGGHLEKLILHLSTDILSALSYLHTRNIVHLDIKVRCTLVQLSSDNFAFSSQRTFSFLTMFPWSTSAVRVLWMLRTSIGETATKGKSLSWMNYPRISVMLFAVILLQNVSLGNRLLRSRISGKIRSYFFYISLGGSLPYFYVGKLPRTLDCGALEMRISTSMWLFTHTFGISVARSTHSCNALTLHLGGTLRGQALGVAMKIPYLALWIAKWTW